MRRILQQFISLTTTKLTANVYTEFSPYLSCTMGNWECCLLIRMLLCKNLFHKALHCNSNNNANETVNSTTANQHGRARNQARIGASIAARPQPAPISNSLLAKEERSWVEVAESPTLNLRI